MSDCPETEVQQLRAELEAVKQAISRFLNADLTVFGHGGPEVLSLDEAEVQELEYDAAFKGLFLVVDMEQPAPEGDR